MKRLIGPLLLVLLLAGVGAAIYFSVRDQFVQHSIVNVRGLISSDKQDFFNDPAVQKALLRGGFVVDPIKAGSREIATGYDLKTFDFAFPAGSPAASKIMQSQKSAQAFDIFYSPMVIASWKPIVQILEANGVAAKAGAFESFNMEAYLKLVDKDVRWKDLQASNAYPVNKSVLLTSADARKSNSGAMYLALASYALNNATLVQSDADLQKMQPLLTKLMSAQGFTENYTEAPFDDYLLMGMSKTPMVMIYESQYIARAAQPGGIQNPDAVLMYPTPTVFSKHVFVAFNDNGARLGQFLRTDPELQQLAIQHGYRTADQAAFAAFRQTNKLNIPDQVTNVVDSPSYELLEKMITNLDNPVPAK